MNRTENGILVFLVNTTTSILGREKFRDLNGFPKETIVYIPKGSVSFLTKDCCIDCNSITKDLEDDFTKRVKGLHCYELPNELVELVRKGICKSPQVEPKIKKAV